MKTDQIMPALANYYRQSMAWILREEHQKKARELKSQLHTAFTEHPEETGESYLQHLWFTFTMSMRFLFTMVVLIIHGLFPFLLMRTASKQIEMVYGIMKSRIPRSRREIIDAGTDPSI